MEEVVNSIVREEDGNCANINTEDIKVDTTDKQAVPHIRHGTPDADRSKHNKRRIISGKTETITQRGMTCLSDLIIAMLCWCFLLRKQCGKGNLRQDVK